ncbi:ATPase [Sphingomonas rubra]|uniref:ATP synthase subunit b n=1 Tax=Sphingomonas rubra TaxID=634430 RepID=A0A1I5UGM0_9SPHN|nr:ATPase [Sphingomonas rubra]SFP94402.1 F-type H+-transporting ATPase subunit b [Sphingomonas rubra]
MPQLSQVAATYASQIFWLLVTFGLLYFVVGRGMVPKIVSTVDAREARVEGDLAAAEAARRTADSTEAAWRAEMDAARAEAGAETAKAKAQATASAEAQVKAADADLAERLGQHDLAIANAKGQALANLENVAAEAAQDIVARIAGLTVGIDQAATAVREVRAHG